jgi:hypothetical protein
MKLIQFRLFGSGTLGLLSVFASIPSQGSEPSYTLPPSYRGTNLTSSTINPRNSTKPAFTLATYNYVPSIMKDGVYKMWWCGGIASDHVLYAEATSLEGPWHSHTSQKANTYDDAFYPTNPLYNDKKISGSPSDFDYMGTCDPSVVKVNGTYYLYYGGYAATGGSTAVGVATSSDGITFVRGNGGKPLYTPANLSPISKNYYGAGQPSVIYLDGYFYLAHTDTTGAGVDGNGGGQFLHRSQDFTFQTGVEDWTPWGFVPHSPQTSTAYAFVDALSMDWQYSDVLDQFVVATSGGPSSQPKGSYFLDSVQFFDRTLTVNTSFVTLPANWQEGPGIVSTPEKHSIPPQGTMLTAANCGTIPLDLFGATSTLPKTQANVGCRNTLSTCPSDPNTWHYLTHFGVDLPTGQNCTGSQWGKLLEHSAVTAANRPLTFITSGKRLQLESAALLPYLTNNNYSISTAVFDLLPYAASLLVGAPADGGPGQPAAFRLDIGSHWPVSCLGILTANGSQIQSTPYSASSVEDTLFCIKQP